MKTMNMVHIYADVEGDWRPTMLRDAALHAKGYDFPIAQLSKPDDTYIGVDSLSALKRLFESFKKKKKPLSKLDFHTHGNAGLVAIGKDCLDVNTLKQFDGHDRIFRNLLT